MEEENLSIVHILWLFVLHRGLKCWVSYHPKYGKSLSYQLPSPHVFTEAIVIVSSVSDAVS